MPTPLSLCEVDHPLPIMAPTTISGLSYKDSDSSLGSEPPGLTLDISSTTSTSCLSVLASESVESIDYFAKNAGLLILAYETCQKRTPNHIPDAVFNELIRQYEDDDPRFDLSPERMLKLINTLKYPCSDGGAYGSLY